MWWDSVLVLVLLFCFNQMAGWCSSSSLPAAALSFIQFCTSSTPLHILMRSLIPIITSVIPEDSRSEMPRLPPCNNLFSSGSSSSYSYSASSATSFKDFHLLVPGAEAQDSKGASTEIKNERVWKRVFTAFATTLSLQLRLILFLLVMLLPHLDWSPAVVNPADWTGFGKARTCFWSHEVQGITGGTRLVSSSKGVLVTSG